MPCGCTLRLVLCASATGLLFDWLHPAHFPTIVAALEAWADVPDVRPIAPFAFTAGTGSSIAGVIVPSSLLHSCYRLDCPSQHIGSDGWFRYWQQVSTAILKFMAEFVLNKTQRLTFDSSSPNGILLFRQVSKVQARHAPVQPLCCNLLASLLTLLLHNAGACSQCSAGVADRHAAAQRNTAATVPSACAALQAWNLFLRRCW